jgi:hypothetical protein
VHAVEVEDRPGPSRAEAVAPRGERVEEPYLDVRVRGKTGEERVGAGGVEVVHQQPHAHAAVGRIAQGTQQVAAGLVVLHKVVLHVDGALRAAREFDARVQRELRHRQQPEPAQRLTGRGSRLHETAERGVRAIADCDGGFALHVDGQSGAAGHAQRDDAEQQPRQPAGARSVSSPTRRVRHWSDEAWVGAWIERLAVSTTHVARVQFNARAPAPIA